MMLVTVIYSVNIAPVQMLSFSLLVPLLPERGVMGRVVCQALDAFHSDCSVTATRALNEDSVVRLWQSSPRL